MDSFKGPRPHHSIPVETDERMSPSLQDGAWFGPCEEKNRNTRISRQEQKPSLGVGHNWNLVPERRYQDQTKAAPASSAHQRLPGGTPGWLSHIRVQVPPSEGQFISQWDKRSTEDRSWRKVPSVEESLEPPLPLISGATGYNRDPAVLHPAARPYGHVLLQESHVRPAAHCAPTNARRHVYYPEDPHRQAQHQLLEFHVRQPPNVMQKVSVNCSMPASPGEVKKTISLPEESRQVFITYSADTAEEMPNFVRFLINQGFKPAIDMFDTTLRRMGINRWMDRYLNDKSVLIIVVISPGYKEDVEGDGDDEHGLHGLHTKYIHNQIQNEFIQQGCMNYRLVPVLFPNATKKQVPNWLQNTDIFRWPQDEEDIVLRLIREERYILPPCAAEVTLTVRPL